MIAFYNLLRSFFLMNTKTTIALVASGAFVCLPFLACSSSDTKTPTKTATAASVAGAADTHCKDAVTVDPAVCHQTPSEDAGDADGGESGGNDYGPTMVGSEADDDDCKYHLKWTSASRSDGNVDFTLTLTTKADGKPVTGAPIDIESYLDDTHPSPNTTQVVKETSPGVYSVGPIAFDRSGQWTVRFHVHEECNDSEQSPHGHGAFFVQVDVK
jgi:hypothetical protein